MSTVVSISPDPVLYLTSGDSAFPALAPHVVGEYSFEELCSADDSCAACPPRAAVRGVSCSVGVAASCQSCSPVAAAVSISTITPLSPPCCITCAANPRLGVTGCLWRLSPLCYRCCRVCACAHSCDPFLLDGLLFDHHQCPLFLPSSVASTADVHSPGRLARSFTDSRRSFACGRAFGDGSEDSMLGNADLCSWGHCHA